MSQIKAPLTLQLLRQCISFIGPGPAEADPLLGDRLVPGELRGWLARLRLLSGVPFSYLISDAALLPLESIRFFYLDRAWTDAMEQGALSVGTVNTADRAQLEKLYAAIRAEVDEQERAVRLTPGEPATKGQAGTITGFLLRSRVVSGFPSLHVRAYKNNTATANASAAEMEGDRLKTLRLERLAPAVLLALFDGVPERVDLEEPRAGIQFGVTLRRSDQGVLSGTVLARDVTTAEEINAPAIPVSFRAGAPGVLDLRATAEAIRQVEATRSGPTVESSEYAVHMLRFPARQVFGDPPPGAKKPTFRPSVGLHIKDLSRLFSTRLALSTEGRTEGNGHGN